MVDPDDDERRRSIGAFADELRQLRVSAGNPSFRKIASRSGCVSHTTVAEAEKGLRFPSWETTREFVRACQGDEADWRGRWERTKHALTPEESVDTSFSKEKKKDLRIPLAVGAVALLGAGALVVVATVLSSNDPPKNTLIEGDHSRFITDVTIPDGTQVQVGEEFVKVWEISNAGTVLWRDRYLQRQDLPVSPNTCQTPERVPIGDTLPNERIKISVRVVAPTRPTTCKIDWKMVDNQGRQFLPQSRPMFFLVHVIDPPGNG